MASETAPSPDATIAVPSAVSALALGPNDSLCVGSEDGCVRWYELPSTKVARAAKSLGDEISSIVWLLSKKNEPVVWIASGRRVVCLPANSTKMILTLEDASAVIELGEDEDEDDVLNELSISENGKHLVFCSDSGTVGAVDLSTHTVSRMKSRHTTVCGSVNCIPDRPNEIISGGYDSALLHFDLSQGTILSRFDITAPQPSEGISLSPPFVLSITVSSTGLLAASTADGRVWLGGGGEKRPNGKKKRSRKWEGLREDEGVWLQAADGPVVSCAFTQPDRFTTCSLLGVLAEFTVTRDVDGNLQASKGWTASTSRVEKVNTMAAQQSTVLVGGFGQDGKGLVEVWRVT